MVNRVLICSNFYPPFFVGGAEIIAHEQARQLKKAGYQVSVFCGKHDDTRDRYSILRDNHDGLDIFRIILHAQDYQIGQDFYKPAVEEQFDAVMDIVQPEVVHAHNLVGLSLGILQRSRLRGIRTVLTLHDHWGFCFKNTLLKQPDTVCGDFSRCIECLPEFIDSKGRLLPLRLRNDYIALRLGQVNQFVSPSAYLASAYLKAGIPSDHIQVISYGIDVSRFSRIQPLPSEGPMRFTFIGHLGMHKGIHVLIKALELLLQRGQLGSLCAVNVVGTGSMGDDLDRFVRENQLESAVKLWGRVEHAQIEAVYQVTDVLLTTSIWPENEPVTILEAKAAGRAILASALGGNLNLVEDGVSGCLFESGNATMLADKMVEMAIDRPRTEAMGQAAYEQVAADTLENYVQTIAAVYDGADSLGDPNAIVLCSGHYVSLDCARAIVEFDKAVESDYPNGGTASHRDRFILRDWLSPDDWANVKLLWVVDDGGNQHEVLEALQHGVPLLVPEHNQSLVELCRAGQCGLFYADELEAEGCLRYLKSNPSLLAALGQNAKRAAEKRLVAATGR